MIKMEREISADDGEETQQRVASCLDPDRFLRNVKNQKVPPRQIFYDVIETNCVSYGRTSSVESEIRSDIRGEVSWRENVSLQEGITIIRMIERPAEKTVPRTASIKVAPKMPKKPFQLAIMNKRAMPILLQFSICWAEQSLDWHQSRKHKSC